MDSLRIGELFAKLKPRILDLINAVGGGAGPFAPTPHDLSSGHHTGSLADAQAPQFLKTDGSRQLVGNLSVAENITIDGVDLSVLKSAYDVHVGLDAATAHGSVGVHTHQNNPQGGQLDHGLALTGLLDDDHTQYAHADGSGTRRAYEAQRLNKSILAGNGLTGGGLLNADQTLSVLLNPSWSGLAVDGNGLRVNTGAAFTWTNDHNFQGITKTRHLYPEFTDTYDLGSSTLLWRKGWLSELDAILFAQNTVTLLGGWLLITKDEGTLAADAGSGDTQINFGKAMTAGDFVLFRAAGKVEYMQVGSLVSGTTYNVTRNLDGSGADTWPAGTPFAVLGQSGQGRIELNAYDTPRLQILTQGATYNAQTEVIRIGDLNGAFGITNPQYGIGIGQYADNQAYLVYTPQSGLRVKGKIIAEGGAIPELRESFDYDNINQFHARVYYWGGGKSITTLETDTGSVSGNKVLKCGDGTTAQTVWFVLGTPIPYNPDKLYRLSARVKRTAGTGTLYVGIAGFDVNLNPCNKTGANSYASQHYIAANGVNPSSSWTIYIGYMRGHGSPFDTANNPSNPSPAHTNVRFISPIIYANYNNVAGITYIDEIRLEEVPDAITADRIYSGTLQIGTKLTIGQVANNKGRLELEALSDGNATLKGIYRNGSGVDTTEAYFGSDGKFYAGNGKVKLDSYGISIGSDSVYSQSSSVKFTAGGEILSQISIQNSDPISKTLKVGNEDNFYEVSDIEIKTKSLVSSSIYIATDASSKVSIVEIVSDTSDYATGVKLSANPYVAMISRASIDFTKSSNLLMRFRNESGYDAIITYNPIISTKGLAITTLTSVSNPPDDTVILENRSSSPSTPSNHSGLYSMSDSLWFRKPNSGFTVPLERLRQVIHLGIAGWQPMPSFAPTLGSQNNYTCWIFPDGVTRVIDTSFVLPANWAGKTVKVAIWYNCSTNSGTVIVGVEFRPINDGIYIPSATGMSVGITVTAHSTADTIKKAISNGAVLSNANGYYNGQAVALRIYRNGGHTSDTMAGDWRVFAVELYAE